MSPEEGAAFMASLEALDKRGWSVGDADMEALHTIFAAGRAYERAAQQGEGERLLVVDRKKLDTLAAIARAIGADANTLESALRRFGQAALAESTAPGADRE